MQKYFRGNYVIPSPKLNKDQKKKGLREFGSTFGPNSKDLFVLAGSFSSDHPALKSQWGDAKSQRGDANFRLGDASPLQFKY